MAAPFGDHGGDGDGPKRPAPTIDGTAEEVAVAGGDPASGAEAAADRLALSPPADAPDPEAEAAGEEPPSGGNGDKSSARSSNEPPPNTSSHELAGFFTHLAAGLLGGVIGVIGLALIWHLFPGLVTGSGRDIGARVTALEQARSSGAGEQAAIADLKTRVSRLEDTLKSLAQQAKQGGSVADAAAVSQQIAAAEKRLQQQIDQKLAQSGSSDQGDVQNLQNEVASLKTRLASLAEAQSDTAEQAKAPNDATEAALVTLRQRLGKLESQVASLSSGLDKTSAEVKSAAAAAALADLRGAALSGHPYETQLDAFKAAAPDADLGPLPDHAKQGLPTLDVLQASFGPAKQRALAAETAPAESSFVDTLIASAEQVVKIHRLDQSGEGSGPEAVLDRAGDDLAHGDLDAAVSEVAGLTGKPADAMADWLAQARQRLLAQSVLNRLSDAAASPDQASAGH